MDLARSRDLYKLICVRNSRTRTRRLANNAAAAHVLALLLPPLLLLRADGLQFHHHQPLQDIYGGAGAGGEECALILSGPGRSSLYDYTYNLLRGAVLYVYTRYTAPLRNDARARAPH